MMNTAKENSTDLDDAQKGRYLTFTLGEEVFGIEIIYVMEIIGMQPITRFPELPEYIKGVINLRGKIIPLMDVRLRFKRNSIDYNERTCIVVVEIRDICVGLIVDGVSEVIAIPDENITEPPQLNIGTTTNIVKNIAKIDDEVKLLLDCDKLLNDEDIAVITESL